MEVAKVKRPQIDSVMRLINNAIQEMERNGIHQWDEIYPDKNTMLSDIDAGNLYSAGVNGSIFGIMTLNEEQSVEYELIGWGDSIRPLVVHRLCIDPNFQGRGIAKYLMQYAEIFAKDNGYSSIRLDAFVANSRAVGLYDSLSYQRKGIVKFRKGLFFCYEKIL